MAHNAHRGGFVSEGLRRYLAQEHWLYVATFADGSSKVGTAAVSRKFERVAEQGGVLVSFVAKAGNGIVVRTLEDRVSDTLHLTQVARKAAKDRAIARPIPLDDLHQMHAEMAENVRSILCSWHRAADWQIVCESWSNPYLDTLCSGSERYSYPTPVSAGQHGLFPVAAFGSALIVTVNRGTNEVQYVVEMSGLVGRHIEFGEYRSAVPPIQSSFL